MDLPGVHTDLPEDPGEAAIARALIDASAGRWQLWFGLQRNNNEMDGLVMAPDIGCFCIEVKAWRVPSIREYSDDHVVTGSGRKIHPLKQAQIAMHGLMSHLDDRGIAKSGKPFFYATAALPFIRRAEMYDACGDEFSRHFEGMLFAEDVADPDEVAKRLRAIGDNPPLGVSRHRHVPRADQIEAVASILNRRVVLPHRPQAEGMADVFRRIHAAAKKAPPVHLDADRPKTTAERRAALLQPGTSLRDGVSRVVFHGKAGTGKTTELLKVALAHALEGRLTLVCCYTKVLASELRARMAGLPGFAEAASSLLVVDLGQLGDTAEDRVAFGGFQTLCVDEAQDVSEEDFGSLRALAAPEAEWFLSDSPEQAIYNQRSAFMDEAVQIARSNGTWETKRMNRRSGIAERLIADAALEIAPDTTKVETWVREHPVKTSEVVRDEDQGAFELDMATEVLGSMPDLVWLPATPGWESRVSAYENLIRDEVAIAARSGRPLDLAILTARVDGMSDEMKKVRLALTRVGVPWLDQVDSSNRRRSVSSGEVRLSTVHSIRGVEAERVLLLDLEGLEAMPPDARPALLNIALSRARAGTRVVLRPMQTLPGTYRAFVEELVEEYTASI